jgi:hypothetical protein
MTRKDIEKQLMKAGFTVHRAMLNGTDIWTKGGYWVEVRATGFRPLKPEASNTIYPFEQIGDFDEYSA